MKINLPLYTILFLLLINIGFSQKLPPIFGENAITRIDSRVTSYLTPKRIVWMSDNSGEFIKNAEKLLLPGTGQADLVHKNVAFFKSNNGHVPSIILDFGREIQGGIQLITDQPTDHRPIKLRVRFGESVSETMSEVDTISGATNDHAMRDFEVQVPWLGMANIGNTGFRFVKIDLIDSDRE